jgi:hypothetical protein
MRLFFVYENSEERKKERKGKREMGIKQVISF